MLHQTAKEIICLLAHEVGILTVPKAVSAVLRQVYVQAHAGTVDVRAGFRHKGTVQAMSAGDGTYRKLKGHDVVRRCQRLVIAEADLMLSGRLLMMRALSHKTHVLQRKHYVSSRILAKIQRSHVKESCLLHGFCGRHGIVIGVKQEKFTFRSHLKAVAKLLQAVHRTAKHVSGISLKGFSVLTVHVAYHSCDLSLLRSPGERLKGPRDGMKIQIRLVFPYKTLDG